MKTCACCNEWISQAEARFVHDNWEGRMDLYCRECSWARCDAFPGECPVVAAVSSDTPQETPE